MRSLFSFGSIVIIGFWMRSAFPINHPTKKPSSNVLHVGIIATRIVRESVPRNSNILFIHSAFALLHTAHFAHFGDVPVIDRDPAAIDRAKGDRRQTERPSTLAATSRRPPNLREGKPCRPDRGDPSCRGSRGSTRNPPRTPGRSADGVPPVHPRWRTSCGAPAARSCSWSRCCYPAGTRCAWPAR